MNWTDLENELDHWRREGRQATFWWRDDDCVEPTPALELLFRQADNIPISLAVIPSLTSRALADELERRPLVDVLQHGWRHVSHELEGLNEYPGTREDHEVTTELTNGRRILQDLFGEQYLPVFVPPFHGFDDRFLSLFRESGLRMISRKGPRSAATIHGVSQINAHCAPIVWTTPATFGSERDHLQVIVDHLQGRRLGRYDSLEPTGLLTHHLDQDERSFEFMGALARLISDHASAKWCSLRELAPELTA